jgi:hypothetical protein
MGDADVIQIVTPATKKRNRNPLAFNCYNKRYEAVSQEKDHYLDRRSVKVTAEKTVLRHYKSKQASHATRESMKCSADKVKLPKLNGPVNKGSGYYNERRIAIKHIYESVFDAPPEEKWHEMKLIPSISHLLNIPSNSHSRVLEILQRVSKEEREYTGQVQRGSGRKALIQHGTLQANIVYRSLKGGLSAKESTCILNMFRDKMDPPMEPLSRSAVQGFMTRSDCIKTRKRQLKKSGKDDPSCQWAQARQAQAEQFLEQLALGDLPEDSYDRLMNPLKPIYTDGIVFWDEHHREVILRGGGGRRYP